MKKALIGCAVLSMMLVSFACTSVRHRFVVEGYQKNPGQMVKRIVMVSDPFPQNRDLAELIGAMTRDLIKTSKNYLVYGTASTEREVAEACKTLDGVLKISVNRADAAGGRIDFEITGELRRCSDKSAVWNATARASGNSRNRSLKNLVQNYVEKYGDLAEVYAAPAYNILQDLVETMPNPELTEDELMEKIDIEISSPAGRGNASGGIIVNVLVAGVRWVGCAAAVSVSKQGTEVTQVERVDMLLGTGLVEDFMRNNRRFTAAEEVIGLSEAGFCR
jgi:probable lipoprotein (TIGR04455 family)